MSKRTLDTTEFDGDDLSFIIKHKTIQHEITSVLKARCKIPANGILLAHTKATMDTLLEDNKVYTGGDDVVYLQNHEGEEQMFVMHGIVGFALLPTEPVLKGIKNNAQRLIQRVLLVGEGIQSFDDARKALEKYHRLVTDMSGNKEFVSSPRQHSASGFPAICFEAPLLTDIRSVAEDASVKESVEIPDTMDSKGALGKFLSGQSIPARFRFTDDNVVDYGEFVSGASLDVKDVQPDELRIGHAVEVEFSIRGVRLSRGDRIIKNHLSSVTILSRKGIPLLNDNKFSMDDVNEARSCDTHIPKKRRRTAANKDGSHSNGASSAEGITKGIRNVNITGGEVDLMQTN